MRADKTEIPKPIIFHNNYFEALDQRKLPTQEIYLEVKSVEECHACIKDMVVRGAPLIGFTALYGLVIWAQTTNDLTYSSLEKTCQYLKSARPTAVNLEYELNRAAELLKNCDFSNRNDISEKLETFTKEAFNQLEKDNLVMAENALRELQRLYPNKKKFRLMTLCNTGYLACGPLGTALGVISYLHTKEMIEEVYACETRPYLQGARLTAFELSKQKIPHHLIVEGAMSYVLQRQNIDAIFVGADRISANGDTANKVGTSTLSIVANHYKVPFFVVAPTSSFDINSPTGQEIEIEMRPSAEITMWGNVQTAPSDTEGFNPSFDVTSGELISGIFCERGLIAPVNELNLLKTLKV